MTCTIHHSHTRQNVGTATTTAKPRICNIAKPRPSVMIFRPRRPLPPPPCHRSEGQPLAEGGRPAPRNGPSGAAKEAVWGCQTASPAGPSEGGRMARAAFVNHFPGGCNLPQPGRPNRLSPTGSPASAMMGWQWGAPKDNFFASQAKIFAKTFGG